MTDREREAMELHALMQREWAERLIIPYQADDEHYPPEDASNA